MKIRIQRIVFVGVFAALAYVLYIFPQFSILPMFEWLKIDFSDVPALYATLTISPPAGFFVMLIKNLLHLTVSSSGGIGELSNFLIGAVFVVTAGLLQAVIRAKEPKRTLFSVALAIPFQVVCAIIVNFFIMIPMYMGVGFDAASYITAGVIPFNFIKSILSAAVFFLVYRFTFVPFSKILRK